MYLGAFERKAALFYQMVNKLQVLYILGGEHAVALGILFRFEHVKFLIPKTDEGSIHAERLGKLAYQILLKREHGKPRSVFAPLTAEGWDVKPEIQAYLEKGLHGSFAEFPQSGWGDFSPPAKTPLDHDVKEVVEFLEAKVEGEHLPQTAQAS